MNSRNNKGFGGARATESSPLARPVFKICTDSIILVICITNLHSFIPFLHPNLLIFLPLENIPAYLYLLTIRLAVENFIPDSFEA